MADMRKNTPESAARTLTEKLRQVLALQKQIEAERKAAEEKAQNHDPNALMKDDEILTVLFVDYYQRQIGKYCCKPSNYLLL